MNPILTHCFQQSNPRRKTGVDSRPTRALDGPSRSWASSHHGGSRSWLSLPAAPSRTAMKRAQLKPLNARLYALGEHGAQKCV